MIKYTPASELGNQVFETPFDENLDMNNRWVVMEKIILWDDIANVLLKRMSSLGLGSVDLRYVLCALLVKVLGKIKACFKHLDIILIFCILSRKPDYYECEK